MNLDILILLSIWLVVCIFCGAAGFFIGKTQSKPPQKQTPYFEESPEIKRQAEQAKREYENFLNYNGNPQDFNPP